MSVCVGNWGCGAFNGDLQLKAVLQLMAAAQVSALSLCVCMCVCVCVCCVLTPSMFDVVYDSIVDRQIVMLFILLSESALQRTWKHCMRICKRIRLLWVRRVYVCDDVLSKCVFLRDVCVLCLCTCLTVRQVLCGTRSLCTDVRGLTGNCTVTTACLHTC